LQLNAVTVVFAPRSDSVIDGVAEVELWHVKPAGGVANVAQSDGWLGTVAVGDVDVQRKSGALPDPTVGCVPERVTVTVGIGPG
jgi:hypothetical protein